MPTLPGLEVTQAHYDRIIAAFPGATLAEKAANYKKWQINAHIDEVSRLESERVYEEMRIDAQEKLEALARGLPARALYPPTPPRINT